MFAFILADRCSKLVIICPSTSMIALGVYRHYFIKIVLFLVRIFICILNENNYFLKFQGVKLCFSTKLNHHCQRRILLWIKHRVVSKKRSTGVQQKYFKRCYRVNILSIRTTWVILFL